MKTVANPVHIDHEVDSVEEKKDSKEPTQQITSVVVDSENQVDGHEDSGK